MLRGPLGNNKYKPKFSGHDTFPFRYAWLTKFVHYIEDGNLKKIKEFEQNKLSTIADFGIGLNMVKSIRHWSIATKICDKEFKLTDFGKMIFSKSKSFDPYLEKSETLWLLHWKIASEPSLTTWYYIFNYHPSIIINKEKIINARYITCFSEILKVGHSKTYPCFEKFLVLITNLILLRIIQFCCTENVSFIFSTAKLNSCTCTIIRICRETK